MEDCLVYLHAPHHQTSNGRETEMGVAGNGLDTISYDKPNRA